MLQIYKSLESGPLQELTLKTLEKGAWINIVDPTPYELKVVSNLTEVDPDFLRSALDDEERSHTDVEENSVMVLTNVPVFRGEDSYDALKRYARDLTEAARDGKVDPVIGRDEEIRRTIQVLARRT